MSKNPEMPLNDELFRSLSVHTAVSGEHKINHGVMHEKTVNATIVAIAIRGRYEVSFADQTWMIHPGESFIIPSNTLVRITHHLDRQGIMQAKWVHLHLTLLGVIDILSLFDLPARLTSGKSQLISQTIDTLQAMKQTSPGNLFENLLHCQQLAVSMARYLINLGQPNPQRIKQLHQSAHLAPVFQAISQHLDRPITIDDLCKWAHLSPSRLHAVFIETTGLSPIRYVLQARLTHARQQLIYTDDPISQIAHSLAFASPFHFSRVFQKAFEMSPNQYRKRNNLSHGI